ncbi:unnamed protein product [Rhizophagus irregularis]|nr:unnamed protein product [Rhizophagus irregularis]
MGKLIEEETNKDRKDEMIRETGIKGSTVEWRNWIILFSLPLLKMYLDKRHLQGWANFVKAVKLCLEPEISEEQIDDVQILLKKFSDYYEREYYQNNGQRLAASIFKEKPLKQWSKERVFSTEGYDEEYYSPSTQYSLLSQEHKHLIKFYEGSSNINRNDLEMEVNNYGVRYGRLRTSDGQYISSCCIKRNNKIARNNYCAQIRRTIDKLAHRPNAPSQLVIVDIYGIVNYYLVHEFNYQVYMLAYVQLTSKIVEDEYGCKHFTQFRSKEFIDVRCLDHCIGFAKIDNRYYIIDKENAFDDSNWENIGH